MLNTMTPTRFSQGTNLNAIDLLISTRAVNNLQKSLRFYVSQLLMNFKLKNKKLPGLDNIFGIHIKNISEWTISFLAKLFKNIYTYENNIIPEFQYDFRSNHSIVQGNGKKWMIMWSNLTL